MNATLLNIFYKEPDYDRWFTYDRYPRRIMRRIVRGPSQPGGVERYYLNLIDGFRRIGIPHLTNSFRYARSHPRSVVGVVGKGHLLTERHWRNPILFGPAGFSHPTENAEALETAPIEMILVSCEWMKQMYLPHTSLPIRVWPAGIDTYSWLPAPVEQKNIDVLVYDKIRWTREKYIPELLNPILERLRSYGLSYSVIKYGGYREEEFMSFLRQSRSMIFLVEHETQGFAYLQALSCDVPILVWDRGGYWRDPAFYPHKVRFEPVTSVPYWDDRCGMKFSDLEEFGINWSPFWDGVRLRSFRPRSYILENLTLEKCAFEYIGLVRQICESG
jgi:glycosyltransferase involved in cell wall biosynthesis